jgi:hypothetical protein
MPTATDSVSPTKSFVLDREQISHCGDLLDDATVDPTFNPDFKHDILQDFDFDSFLRQDDENSKFNLTADGQLSSFPAPHTPYTTVHASCSIAPAEEEPPIYINAKQFHRILRRRAARQAQEESAAQKSHRPPLDTLKEQGARNSEMSMVQASGNTTSPTSALEGRIKGEKALTPAHVFSFSSPSGTYCRPVDTHSASRLPDPNRVRDPGASKRFRERRRQLDKEAREREANKNVEKSTKPSTNSTLSQLEPFADLPLITAPLHLPTHARPFQLHFSTTPSGRYNVPFDLSPASRSVDEKRTRKVAALARFRERRRQKRRRRWREGREKKRPKKISKRSKRQRSGHTNRWRFLRQRIAI